MITLTLDETIHLLALLDVTLAREGENLRILTRTGLVALAAKIAKPYKSELLATTHTCLLLDVCEFSIRDAYLQRLQAMPSCKRNHPKTPATWAPMGIWPARYRYLCTQCYKAEADRP